MISMDKKYRTRSGHPVELLTVTGQEPYPVVGYIEGTEKPFGWTTRGRYDFDSIEEKSGDLIEVVEPVTRSLVWANLYPETSGAPHTLHATPEAAARYRSEDCLACVEVFVTYTPGEGL